MVFRNRAPSSSRWPINSSWPSAALTQSIVLTKEKGGGIGADCLRPGAVGAVGAVVAQFLRSCDTNMVTQLEELEGIYLRRIGSVVATFLVPWPLRRFQEVQGL